MLTTQELVSELKLYYAPEWDREVIVDFVRKAQLGLCLLDSREMVFWNRSDPLFPIPYLKTESGRLSYEVGDYGDGTSGLLDSSGNEVLLEAVRDGQSYPVQARRIRSLFVERAGGVSTARSGSPEDGWYYHAGQETCQRFSAVEFIPDDMSGTEGAKVTFVSDPGDTEDKYFCSFYFTPVDLLSDTLPLTIDGDQWRQALVDGAVGMIEDIENGRSERLVRYERYWKKKFLNHTAQVVRHYASQKMTRRLCG